MYIFVKSGATEPTFSHCSFNYCDKQRDCIETKQNKIKQKQKEQAIYILEACSTLASLSGKKHSV